ncbi:hypothetical protein GCM10010201_08910 [Pilimelia columellifera subsp. columellifera]|uniref:Uncharacterized protein n=1 Tax=Pilimelia columellifera subsp. columellifera TaxID=706583 RepID=A0ABN3N5R9_9ACTN
MRLGGGLAACAAAYRRVGCRLRSVDTINCARPGLVWVGRDRLALPIWIGVFPSHRLPVCDAGPAPVGVPWEPVAAAMGGGGAPPGEVVAT